MAEEKAFETKVKAFLDREGCWFFKVWGGGFQKAGIPDIMVCCNGMFVGVEVKGPCGRPSPLQIRNLNLIHEAGGYGILLYPNDYNLFRNFIRCLKYDQKNAKLNYQIFRKKITDWEMKLNE